MQTLIRFYTIFGDLVVVYFLGQPVFTESVTHDKLICMVVEFAFSKPQLVILCPAATRLNFEATKCYCHILYLHYFTPINFSLHAVFRTTFALCFYFVLWSVLNVLLPASSSLL